MRAIDGVEGWLTIDQAARLYAAARTVPPGGRIVEIGSFQGRSTIVLARAAPSGVDIVAIDPHSGSDRGPRQPRGRKADPSIDRARFEANLDRSGVRHRVRHLPMSSSAALDATPGLADVVYVDGAHRYGIPRADLARWGARVPSGGALLVHDVFSSVGVTVALLRLLIASPRWRYEGRSGSLVEYRRVDRLAARQRFANAGRQLAPLPWFARNLVIKALLVARLAPVARRLGHSTGEWPY